MKLRATTKVRNDAMISARERLGMNQGALAKASGVPNSAVYDLEKLVYRRTNIEEEAMKIAIFLKIQVDDIYSPELKGTGVQTEFKQVKEVDPENLISAANKLQIEGPDIDLERKEMKEAVYSALDDLTFKEREIIKHRYKLDGYKFLTLDECGKLFKVRRERVSQLEAKAMRKLQHPVRARKLKEHIDQSIYEYRPEDQIIDLELKSPEE